MKPPFLISCLPCVSSTIFPTISKNTQKTFKKFGKELNQLSPQNLLKPVHHPLSISIKLLHLIPH